MSLDEDRPPFLPIGESWDELEWKEAMGMATDLDSDKVPVPRSTLGWACPVCQKGVAPWAHKCGHCSEEPNDPTRLQGRGVPLDIPSNTLTGRAT